MNVNFLARYIGKPDDKATISCDSISLLPEEATHQTSADGAVMKSVVVKHSILLKGADISTSVDALGFEPTDMSFNNAGATKEHLVRRRDTTDKNIARFEILDLV